MHINIGPGTLVKTGPFLFNTAEGQVKVLRLRHLLTNAFSFHSVGASMLVPLWTQRTVISLAYSRFCSSWAIKKTGVSALFHGWHTQIHTHARYTLLTLGVMKKYWDVVSLQAVRTTMLKTLLSFTGSIPCKKKKKGIVKRWIIQGFTVFLNLIK